MHELLGWTTKKLECHCAALLRIAMALLVRPSLPGKEYEVVALRSPIMSARDRGFPITDPVTSSSSSQREHFHVVMGRVFVDVTDRAGGMGDILDGR